MKNHIYIAIIAIIVLFAHTIAYQDELDQDCFTDSCIGCIEDCN